MKKIYDMARLHNQLAQFPGEYEIHVTVDIESARFSKFKQICEQENAKALIIELEHGDSPVQPMLSQLIRLSPNAAAEHISRLVSVLEPFNVTRVKVEASPRNQGVPRLDSEALGLPVDCYFEHHIKLLLTVDEDIEELSKNLKPFFGHISRNALKRTDVGQERFVTQRFFQCGDDEANKKLLDLKRYLQQREIAIKKVIREFNIFDSNVGLDRRWIKNAE